MLAARLTGGGGSVASTAWLWGLVPTYTACPALLYTAAVA